MVLRYIIIIECTDHCGADHHLGLGPDPLNSMLKTVDVEASPINLDGDFDFPFPMRLERLTTESPDDPDDLVLPGPVGSLNPSALTRVSII